MFAVSTCWKSGAAESGDEILTPILDARIEAVELEYRITEKIFKEMIPAFKRGKPSVVSVHNYFPVLPDLTRDQAGGDVFSLSSLEKEGRELAVKYTLRTLEYAHEVGAKAVVLHMGRTEMDDGFARLKEEREEGKSEGGPDEVYVRSLLEKRETAGEKHLDPALFTLDKLWRAAERFGIMLGIENRYHLREIPNEDELTVIFDKFEGGNIGYWHDVGHASVQEYLYGVGHEELLSRFSANLVGIHLHDAEGTADHLSPGKGTVDFEMVRGFLGPDTIRVLEIGPDVTEGDLASGIGFLLERGLLGN